MYRRLDPDRIIATLEQLEARIGERFPQAGLRRVCQELLDVARQTKSRMEAVRRPHLPLRAMSLALTGTGLVLLYYVGSIIEIKRDADNLFGVLQGIDSAFNILIVMGATALFLSSVEARWKRQRLLADLHELRSLVHVIDMHQLTKDPSAGATVATGTPSSPQRQLTPFELVRYLDYCSELLSLAAKVAALYAQHTRDPVIIAAESELAQITSNMAGKIWQKITIVQDQMRAEAGSRPVAPPLAKV
jgi:hypothetical protein